MKIKNLLCSLVCLCMLSGCSGEPQQETESNKPENIMTSSVGEHTESSEVISDETTSTTLESNTIEPSSNSSESNLEIIAKPGDVLYDKDGITVSLTGLQEDSNNKLVVLMAENKTDFKATVALWYTSVNDYMFEDFQSTMDNTISPHKKGKVIIELDKNNLLKEGLNNIKTVSGDLSIIFRGADPETLSGDKYIEVPVVMNFQ